MKNSGREKSILERYFKGMKVIEAKDPLVVYPNETDAKRAKQGDPKSCVIAKACKRMYGSSAVVILRKVAYVDLPNRWGGRDVHRYELTQSARKAIVEFDTTGAFPVGGFKLRPHSPSRRLDRMRETERARRKAALKGTMKGKNKARGTATVFDGVRNGTGLVHFK